MAAPAVNQTGKVAEGKVTFGLTETTGKINYTYTANAGFCLIETHTGRIRISVKGA